MKELLEQLKKQKGIIEDKITFREDCFDNKSENWKGSDTGDNYENKTMGMEDFLSNIEECIDYIEESLE